MATSIGKTLRPIFCGAPRLSLPKGKNHVDYMLKRCSRLMCTQINADRSSIRQKDPAALFLNDEVQSILKKLTGFDLDKIFRVHPTSDFGAPKYELMTDKQLKEVNEEFMKAGQERLQMPPVMKSWDDSVEILSEDPEIAGFATDTIVFTDITYGIKRRSRMVVIREPNGVLRTASAAERDSIMQLYYPHDGRMYQTPKMFDAQNLEEVLSQGRYEYVLDHTCLQFEPDNPEYLRVTQRTYEHIDSTGSYEDLRSTRHFGGMAFYYASHRKIDGLLTGLIQRDRLEHASDLVRLYHVLNPECKSSQLCKEKPKMSHKERIQAYAANDSPQPSHIELALQTYREQHS